MRRLRSARWKCEVIFDVDGKLAEIETLNAKAEDPGFWSDAEAAQKVQRRLAALRSSVETWEGLNGDVEDAAVLPARWTNSASASRNRSSASC